MSYTGQQIGSGSGSPSYNTGFTTIKLYVNNALFGEATAKNTNTTSFAQSGIDKEFWFKKGDVIKAVFSSSNVIPSGAFGVDFYKLRS